jgi:hypothetical protein
MCPLCIISPSPHQNKSKINCNKHILVESNLDENFALKNKRIPPLLWQKLEYLYNKKQLSAILASSNGSKTGCTIIQVCDALYLKLFLQRQ